MVEWEKQREYLIGKPIAAFYFHLKMSKTLNAHSIIYFFRLKISFHFQLNTQKLVLYNTKFLLPVRGSLPIIKGWSSSPCLTNRRHMKRRLHPDLLLSAYLEAYCTSWLLQYLVPYIKAQLQEPLCTFWVEIKDFTKNNSHLVAVHHSWENLFSDLANLFSFSNTFCS